VNNRDLVISYLKSFASGDPDLVVEHVSEDFQNIQLGELGTGCEGREAYRQRLQHFLADFENLEYQVEDVIVEGDNVATTYTMTFKQHARTISIPGVMVFTLAHGLINVRKDYWDGLSYQRQTAKDE
jgi:ketosteroid isomerase-like protein